METIEAAITRTHKALEAIGIKNLCYKTQKEEYSEAVKKQTVIIKEFISVWGSQRWTVFNMYSTLKTRLQNVPGCMDNSSFKLKNSKGNARFGA